jgi:hypothetical protein
MRRFARLDKETRWEGRKKYICCILAGKKETRGMCLSLLMEDLFHPSHGTYLPPKQSSIVSNACFHRSMGMLPHPTASQVHAGGKTTKREATRDRPPKKRGLMAEAAEEEGVEGGGGAE